MPTVLNPPFLLLVTQVCILARLARTLAWPRNCRTDIEVGERASVLGTGIFAREMRHTVVVMMAAMEKTRMTRRTMRKKTLLGIGGCGGMQYDRTSDSPSEDHRLISVCFVTWRNVVRPFSPW